MVTLTFGFEPVTPPVPRLDRAVEFGSVRLLAIPTAPTAGDSMGLGNTVAVGLSPPIISPSSSVPYMPGSMKSHRISQSSSWKGECGTYHLVPT